jgi:general secretion pathway protein J
MNNSTVSSNQQLSGFTLLELLIAITVFSIISTITYSSMKVVLDTEEQTNQHLSELSKLQLGLTLMQRDIEQASIREIRNEFGDTQAPMLGRQNESLFVEFTRGGYPNPMRLPRSNLQRVGYALEDEVLYRISWQSLDRAQEENPRRSQLIDDVQGIKITYYDNQMKPHDEWPPARQNAQTPTPTPLPKAIELILELETLGNIRRLFRVAESPNLNT